MTHPSKRAHLPLLFAAPSAVVGGFFIRLGFPGPALWWLTLIGVCAVLISLWHQRPSTGAFLGLLAGASWWLPLINWLTLYLGPVPWSALAGAMIVWTILMGSAIALTTSWILSRWPTAIARVPMQVIAVSGIWVAKESIQSSFPYGGFPWGRLAHTQAEGPLVAVVSYTGFAGLTGLLVLLCAIPVAIMFQRTPLKHLLTGTLATVVAGVALSAVPVFTLPSTGSLTVAAVQGNSKSGVFDDRDSGDVIADHIRVTRELLAFPPEDLDVIVWPENSAEFGLLSRPENLRKVQDLAQQAQVPIVVGSVLKDVENGTERFTNSSLVIDPETRSVQRYDKRHPVPFAEYMPHRSFYHALVPDLVDMVQLEYEEGTTPSVLPVADMLAGIAICFDIIFDDMAVSMTQDGASIVFAQTNNADFGFTDQSEQQTLIAKLRAVEMGRSLVNISTVATSEMILPTGETVAEIKQWQPGWMSAELPLVSGETPALRYGAYIAGSWMIFAAVLTALAAPLRRSREHEHLQCAK